MVDRASAASRALDDRAPPLAGSAQQPAYQVFISYRRDDSGYANAQTLFKDLAQVFGRLTIFLDEHVLSPGSSFPDELESKLLSCRVLLVVVTPDLKLHLPEDWVAKELTIAMTRRASLAPRPPLIVPVFPCVPKHDRPHRGAWKRAVDALADSVGAEFQDRIDQLRGATPAYLVNFGYLADREGAELSELWELHSRELLKLTQRLRAEGVETHRPSASWKDLKAFSVVVAGDVSRHPNAEDRIAMMVLGNGLLDLKLRFPHIGLAIVLAKLPDPPGDRFVDAASVIERYIEWREPLPDRHSMNPWALLANWGRDFPDLGNVRIKRSDCGFDSGEFDDLCEAEGNRVLITVGLHGKAEPWFVSSSLRQLLATLYARLRARRGHAGQRGARLRTKAFDHWKWQWLAFPDPGQRDSKSDRRYRRLRSGAVDATTLSGSAWAVARLEDHFGYLKNNDPRGALDFGRDMSRLLRSLMLAPMFKPLRWRQLWPSAAIAAALVALVIGAFGLARPRASPPLFTACGSTTVAEEYFEDDLDRDLHALGLHILGKADVAPFSLPGLDAQAPEQRTYHIANGANQPMANVVVLATGTNDLPALVDQQRCDLGMVSNLSPALRDKIEKQNGRPIARAREQLVPIVAVPDPGAALPTFDEIRTEVCEGGSHRYDLILRDEASGTRRFLQDGLCGTGKLRNPDRTVHSNSEVLGEVSIQRDRPTLGFIPSKLIDPDRLANKGVRALSLSPDQLVRDLYYVEFRGRLADGQVHAFLDATQKDNQSIRLRLCGSSSIGSDILPKLLEDFARDKVFKSRVRMEPPSLAPHQRGELIPTYLYSFSQQGVAGAASGATDNVRYVVEVATPGSLKMQELLSAKMCDIGMTSAGRLDKPPSTWSPLRWGSQDVYALQPASVDVPWANIASTLCEHQPAANFSLALRHAWSGTRKEVIDHACQGTKLDPVPQSVAEFRSNTEVVEAVARSPATAPVVAFAPEEVFKRPEFIDRVKVIPQPGGGDWKFSRELMFYMDTESQNHVEANRFWEYLSDNRNTYQQDLRLSGPAQCVASGTDHPRCDGCLKPYPRQGDDAQRLDADVVFAADEGRLKDPAGAIEKILAGVHNGDCADRDVLVLGIESSPPSKDQHLADERADFVADLLEQASPAHTHIQRKGVGVDHDPAGRPRVEIWLVPRTGDHDVDKPPTHAPAPAPAPARRARRPIR
jgi:hypothetical protein